MNFTILQNVLLWCTVINYGLLVIWVLLYVFAKDSLYRFATLYRLPKEHFDTIQVAGIAAYKLAVIFFNLVPYIVLRFIVG